MGNKAFDYTLGDSLDGEIVLWNGKRMKFKGIDIRLNKQLPHIYLDSHHDSRMSGPRFTISKKQQVSLEGNFDKYFYLYAADGYKQLALSIITPDVMQTLIDSTSKFDVEIKGTHLRLISQRGVFKRRKRESEILQAAQPILEEIVHRLASWNATEIEHVRDTQLHMIPEQSFKLGKRSYRISYLICAFIGVFFSSAWLIATSAAGSRTGIQSVADSTRLVGVIVSFMVPILLLFTLEYWQRHSPRTLSTFFSYFK